MLLERGITGFFNCEPLEENDYTAFKRACYAVRDYWDLRDIGRPDCANYFYAQFTADGQNLYLLLNRYYPVIGFTHALDLYEKTFIDVPENPVMNYDIVPAEILNAPFKNIKHNLSKGELKEIQYWNPISIGNILFNEWD